MKILFTFFILITLFSKCIGQDPDKKSFLQLLDTVPGSHHKFILHLLINSEKKAEMKQWKQFYF